MNNSVLLKVLVRGAIASLLIAVGIFVYVEWDLKRFNASLKKPPVISQDTVSPDDVSQREKMQEDLGQTTVVPLAASEDAEEEQIASEVEEMNLDEQTFTELDSQGDAVEPQSQETSVDEAISALTDQEQKKSDRKAAVADYNTYLTTDPEYAYTRLGDVFRGDFGDIPEVDILVESIRKINNGPLTVDEAITYQEAILGTLPPNESMAASMVLQQIEHLKELTEEERAGAEPTKSPIILRSSSGICCGDLTRHPLPEAARGRLSQHPRTGYPPLSPPDNAQADANPLHLPG